MEKTNERHIGDEEKVERFEVAYNRIHVKLKELVGDTSLYASYSDVLYRAKNKRNIVHQNYKKLKKFGHLRNSIVHDRLNQDFFIAVPHLQIVEEIERICSHLWSPPLALSIASQPVTICNPSTSLEELLEIMHTNGFSQVPVYDEREFVGLLTEGGIIKWISENMIAGLVQIEDAKAQDILPLEEEHNVHFISRKKTIYDLEDIFEDYYEKNKKLEAILITETGQETQKPIGIVTSWDLVQIDNTALLVSNHI
jgi:predicted transcriptional regulator